MPGIVGLIRRDGPQPSVTEALRKLDHLGRYLVRELPLGPHVTMGQTWRPLNRADGDWCSDLDRHVTVMLHGAAFVDSPSPRRIDAGHLLAEYVRDGRLDPARYDGGFVAVVFDAGRRRLFVWNDRLGSLPVYYTSSDRAFCFGPEAKAVLTALGIDARLCASGVINFVACGYCLNDQTVFDSLKILEPGCVIEVDLATLHAAVERYWTMVYEPASELRSRRSAEAALYEALLDAHRLVLADDPPGFDLLLSGGLDSRGVLACLAEIGRLPTRGFGWGTRPDIPGSDPYLAAEIARAYGIPFDFKRYDSDAFVENAHSWAYISELANDNIGWYAEGQSVLVTDYDTPGAFMLTGDEFFGGASWVRNEEEVRSEVLPSRLPGSFRSILNERVEEHESIYRAQVDGVLRRCENDKLIDRRSYYYLYARIARFNLPFGHYKEIAVEVRRPLVARRVVEVIRHLRGRHRAYKNLYLSMLARQFPLAASLPSNTVDSLPDWEYDVRAKAPLRGLFVDLLATKSMQTSIFSELLDLRRFEELRDRFFSEPLSERPSVRAEHKGRMSRLVPSRVRRESLLFDRIRRAARRRTALTSLRSRGTFDTLRSIALIRLLEAKLHDIGGRRPASG